MKKWTFIIITIVLSLLVNNCYASEIYEDEIELSNNGKLIINFYSKDSDTIKTPVQNVVVEVLYDDYTSLIDIRELPEMQNLPINLVSDVKGNIVINNLPYGLYQYKVISVPEGFDYSGEEKTFGIDLLNSTMSFEEVVIRKVEMAESTVKGPDEKIEIPYPDTIESPEETQEKDSKEEEVVVKEEKVEQPVKEEKKIIETNINEVSEIVYKVDNNINTEKVEPEKVQPMKLAITKIRESIQKPSKDAIQEFQKNRISSAMKDAIIAIDNPVNEHFKMIADLPDDGDDKKKKKVNNNSTKVEADLSGQKKEDDE